MGLKMSNDSEKTISTNKNNLYLLEKGTMGFSNTQQISRETFTGRITTVQYAFLEVMDQEKRRFNLSEEDVIIGRVDDCDIQIVSNNVSRRHARISFSNEEYKIEDLGSTNGIYINGVKVERCILRKHDVLEIGGIKILFIEEKVMQDHGAR
jgi:pSer/pThr/pTyr-binding forkhead associated (FHA) protein